MLCSLPELLPYLGTYKFFFFFLVNWNLPAIEWTLGNMFCFVFFFNFFFSSRYTYHLTTPISLKVRDHNVWDTIVLCITHQQCLYTLHYLIKMMKIWTEKLSLPVGNKWFSVKYAMALNNAMWFGCSLTPISSNVITVSIFNISMLYKTILAINLWDHSFLWPSMRSVCFFNSIRHSSMPRAMQLCHSSAFLTCLLFGTESPEIFGKCVRYLHTYLIFF